MSVARWRWDVDALEIALADGRACFVHRRAFRALIGRDAAAADCLAFHARHAPAFAAAARAKPVAPDRRAANLHLTSRDVRRVLFSDGVGD